ncbi:MULTISPECIES: thermonuclease family protein [Agrobacterium]|uniref:thermonuclease family protein n=1 Tax=Agrobacterium TaxID=357 RepID=UPI001574D45E|nr:MULTISPECIES: thermonuclease family protein [Agrobacterium]NTJ44172.1 thermonuclease family protein [Agrobacterium larrymoorei]WCK22482.1 thermonuclease family protein [Agrobacterium tumefaciens]
MKHIPLFSVIIAAIATPTLAADLQYYPPRYSGRVAPPVDSAPVRLPIFKGVVTVLDGRTLWYGSLGRGYKVRLANIDACELPQWALNPKWVDRTKNQAPMPVPCGPLAKAWLKRTIGNKVTVCTTLGYGNDGISLAQCTVKGRDVATEMLRVGWARLDSPYANQQYLSYQHDAMAARYGMWGTYVLDMNEWRRKAVDKTLERRPLADFNLLAERKSEISPPFDDARNKPKRTDR